MGHTILGRGYPGLAFPQIADIGAGIVFVRSVRYPTSPGYSTTASTTV